MLMRCLFAVVCLSMLGVTGCGGGGENKVYEVTTPAATPEENPI